MDRAKRYFYYGMLLFAFFPILPNKLKGLPVAVLFLSAIFLFVKHRTRTFNFKKAGLYASLYIVYVVSLFYTENRYQIDRTLSTRVSLLILPIIFGLASTAIQTVSADRRAIFLKIYFISSLVYCGLIIGYFYQIGFLTQAPEIGLFYSHLTYEMWYLNQHPIYASLFIAIGFLFGIKLLLRCRSTLSKTMIVLGNLGLFSMLLFLSRKGVILAMVLASLPIIMAGIRNRTHQKIFLGTFLAAGLIILFTPYTQQRFKEVLSTSSYQNIEASNSTSIRFGIYKCSVALIKEQPLFGYGIGDVKTVLRECYAKSSSTLLKENYNSHNQYLSILLGTGIIGLIVFFVFLWMNFKRALIYKNDLNLSLLILFSILMLFENLLERQSGVLLFSFFLNFFGFINVVKERNKS